MSFFEKIKKRVLPEKQQPHMEAKKNRIKGYFSKNPKLMEKFPDIYTRYETVISENELDKMRDILKTYTNRESIRKQYLEYFERDARLQELYQQEYMQLQKECSEETWSVLKPTVDKQLKREWHKEKILEHFNEDEILKNKCGDIYAQLLKAVTDEEVEKCENLLQDYEIRRKNCNSWLAYLDSFPKLKEKYAKEYELLQKDLSEEEYRTVVGILHYEQELLRSLSRQYDAYVKEITEGNYAVGKVEKLYKGYISDEELMRKYPEDAEALIKHYGPEFDTFFFEKNGNPKYTDWWGLDEARKEFRFQDMSYFRKFIERNQVFSEYVITDREYTIISSKLKSYIPGGRPTIPYMEISYTGYSITYENFLLVKEKYPEEVAFYASDEEETKDIGCFVFKVEPYLTKHALRCSVQY